MKQNNEDNQYPLDVKGHQMPDHPSKRRSGEGHGQHQLQKHFGVFRYNVEGHYGQSGVGYLFDAHFKLHI
jgi:hypothetical protein